MRKQKLRPRTTAAKQQNSYYVQTKNHRNFSIAKLEKV